MIDLWAELPSVTRRFTFAYDDKSQDPLTVYVIVTLADGRPVRIDCPANDTGSLERGLLRGFCTSINQHLDKGVSVAELAPLFRGSKFEPTALINLGGKAYFASSPLDGIFAWLEQRWGGEERAAGADGDREGR